VVAWCHGAPGIGLSRLRALAIDSAPRYRRDVRAAIRSSRRSLNALLERRDSDFSLCHGLAGIAEFLITAGRVLGDTRASQTATDVAVDRSRWYADQPGSWPCGVSRGSHPSLMLGLAGIGYFFLRLADPAVPTILLPGSDSAPEGDAGGRPRPSDSRSVAVG
jgi:lantibiotic modifying enzyme